MPKKLSGVHVSRRLDPKDFLRTYLGSKPLPQGVRADPFEVKNNEGLGSFSINYELMEELIKETVAYRNFWITANNLSQVVERGNINATALSMFVDEFNQAKRACQDLDIMYLDPAKIKVEH